MLADSPRHAYILAKIVASSSVLVSALWNSSYIMLLYAVQINVADHMCYVKRR